MKRMIRFSLCALIIFLFAETFAQETTSYFFRNYRSDLTVSTTGNQNKKAIINSYGEINSSSYSSLEKYIFQGQEYETSLGLYLFPYRLFALEQKRFIQPDPKSQYFSPYLFVNANPVNIVDRDGRMGRALFIYGDEHDYPNAKSPVVQDLEEAFPRAYTVPMSDVINGDVGPIPEWNGNVFVLTHSGPGRGHEVEVERGQDISKFNTDSFDEGFLSDGVTSSVNVSGEHLGERLRELSDERGVPVKNVFFGGCQGSDAAQGISDGFVGSAKPKGFKARFIGAKKGVYSFYETPIIYKEQGMKAAEEGVRLHLPPEQKDVSAQFYSDETGKKKFLRMRKVNSKDKIVGVVPSADRQEISDLVRGRVPQNLEREFDVFDRVY